VKIYNEVDISNQADADDDYLVQQYYFQIRLGVEPEITAARLIEKWKDSKTHEVISMVHESIAPYRHRQTLFALRRKDRRRVRQKMQGMQQAGINRSCSKR